MAAARPNLLRIAVVVAIWGGLVLAPAQTARAQFYGLNAGELSETVYVDKVDAAVRTHLEQVDTYLASQQWEEAIETLRQLQQSHGGKVVNLTPSRFVNLRDYCHLRILQMGPQGLALYRQRVDPTAETWHRKGVEARDAALLRQVVDELFCSSWTDQALFALGELALEAGDYAAARRHWERIVPSPVSDQPTLRLAIPDTDLALTDIRARLVLTSILEGAVPRADDELTAFERLHPGAEGQLAGRRVAYAPVLRSLLEASREWPQTETAASWSTFAGNPARQAVPAKLTAIGSLEWRRSLEAPPALEGSSARSLGFRPRRVAEDNDQPLSFHPVMYERLVLLAGPTGISAFELETGKPAWRNPIFSDVEGVIGRPRIINRVSVGAPRYTLTVQGHRLYARMGSAITSLANESLTAGPPGYVVCLDLEQQGKELWRRVPQEEGWAFDGTPVADNERVYVAMRRTDVRPQAHVACFDAESGRTMWTQKVSAAETPARGQFDEITHNLLTLERDALYFNTNLGTVASLETKDGRIRWITQYRRNTHSDLSRPAAQFYRDLTPAVFANGRVYVAPSDSPSILALEAATGQIIWETHHAEDAVHLLGVGGGRLVASGDRLWWIDVESGQVVGRWPDGPSPRGFGRGLLAGDQVLFPTREEIFVFDQRTGKPAPAISLAAQFEGVNGGNLLWANDYLLLTTANRLRGHELIVFSPLSRLRKKLREELTAYPNSALLHVRLAKCEAALGNVAEAIELFHQAQAQADRLHGLEAALVHQLVRGQLYELHERQANEYRQHGEWEPALAAFEQALAVAPTKASRLDSLLAAAETALDGGHFDRAGHWYECVLADDELRTLPVVHDPTWTTEAGVFAQLRLERLTREQPAAAAPSEQAARLASFLTPVGPSRMESTPAAAPLELPLARMSPRGWPSRLVAVQEVSGAARYGLYHQSSNLHCVSLESGSTLWSAPSEQPAQWAGAADDSIVWLTLDRAVCVDAAKGQPNWTAELPRGFPLARAHVSDSSAEFTLSARERAAPAVLAVGRLIVSRPLVGLSALDLKTGATAWTYAPAEGRLVGGPVVIADEILVTTAAPDDVVQLDARTGALLARWPAAGHSQRPPVVIHERRALTVSAAGRIQMWDRSTGRTVWSRAAAATRVSSADPDVLANADHVIVFVAGRGLQCLEPSDGRLRWQTDDASDPRAGGQPAVLAGLDHRAVYAVWDQRLRAFDLQTGRPLWQRLLSDRALTWQVERSGAYLACWPQWSPGQSTYDVWLLAADTGRPLQHMPFVAPADATRIVLAGDRLVVTSPQRSWLLAGDNRAAAP